MGNFFKKFGPSLLAVGAGLLPVFAPAIQGAIANHPSIAAGLFAAYSVIAHILPSPNQVGQPKP